MKTPPVDSIPLSQGIASLAFSHGEPVIANDYYSHPHAYRSRILDGKKSVMSLPLKSGGEPVGVLLLGAPVNDHFNSELVRLLTAIGDGLGVLLENVGLRHQVEATAAEITVVDEIAKIITSTLNIDQVYDHFASEVKKLMEFDRAAVNLVDDDWSSFHIAYLWQQGATMYPKGATVPFERTQVSWVVENCTALIQDDFSQDTYFIPSKNLAKEGYRSLLAVPLVSKGKILGVFSVLEKLDLQSDRFGFEPEITAKVARMKCRVYEVAISYHGRGYEAGKKITWRDGLAAIGCIIRYRFLG